MSCWHSDDSDDLSVAGSFMKPKNDNSPQALETTSSLEDLQSVEQRKILNIVDQLRQCDLESTLFLPQLVVCDDQSAGKSSVLEALTEIPFPRNDNLCTRFATEIILRRVTSDVITVKVISNNERLSDERAFIESFKEFISNFEELSSLMNKTTTLMKINNKSTFKFRVFVKDVLSIEIEDRSRPQLTLIDLSRLVQTETREVIEENVQLVIEIIDHYISQPRTICLTVISTINDYANQDILKKIRKVDPKEDRTLDIITKLDRLSFGSDSESAFLDLARNDDIFFKLGWHVLKNRSYEESSSSFEQRNISEINYFRRSKFFILSKECVEITSLRNRLSQLLFDHVKQKLSKLRKNLEKVFTNTQFLLETMSNSRATPQKCKVFLTQLSLNFYEIDKVAVNEHYEEEYFAHSVNHAFSVESSSTIRRLRAVVQYKNCEFFNLLRTHGYKYHISEHEEAKIDDKAVKIDVISIISTTESVSSIHWSKSRAMNWVREVLVRTRDKKLLDNFNSLLIDELFWEQSSKWQKMIEHHIENVANVCSRFLDALLREKCFKNVYTRLWSFKVEDALQLRFVDSVKEMKRITEDIKSYSITYNHYYTDTIKKRRREREEKSLISCIDNATQHIILPKYRSNHTSAQIDSEKAAREYSDKIDSNMKNHSCEEALDCLYSIYKISELVHVSDRLPHTQSA